MQGLLVLTCKSQVTRASCPVWPALKFDQICGTREYMISTIDATGATYLTEGRLVRRGGGNAGTPW